MMAYSSVSLSLNRPVDDILCNYFVNYILLVVGQLLQVTLVKLMVVSHSALELSLVKLARTVST
jgi:hypothetical protein